MINKKIIAVTLLAALVFNACQQKENRDLATNIPLIKEHNVPVENPYRVEFPIVSTEYILEKAHVIENFYNDNINKSGYTGSFLVAKNGQIIYENYSGVSDRRGNDSINSETPMHVASVGKVVTAVAVLRLVDAGLISLDQSVSEIIKGFPYPEITVRTLLSHRSGLRYYGYYKNIWDIKKTVTNEDVINTINDKKVTLDFKPNSKFTYSNTNYVLLASIVERVTNKTFKQALRELIFEPLDMAHSFVFDDVSLKNQVTQSFYKNSSLQRWDYLDGTYGDKNIYTTPRDFLKLDTALYSDNFLSADLKQEMYKGYSYESKGKRNYGLGMRLIEMDNGDNYTYHNGWWRGNTSSYIRLAKDNVCIILFSNKYSSLTYKTVSLAHHFGDYPVGDMEL
ncbi:beta-lactamase family protein [Myroides sp. M-43]|uniref:serine hydrolase domain-containing protein n=1 Tax=Myroides oncorhynchi TaxID=2893756 RepID=UPI001E4695B6|nr:serine hydrolase domain-containing protein [Myroides oncorhynchi]MCC9043965.1 beta-lactamase family protein [Myroides oncorhynchi]